MADTEGEPIATAQGVTSTPGDSVGPSAASQYLLVFDAASTYMFPLPASGEVDIGRHPSSALRLAESAVSRHHAKLIVDDGVCLVDLGSQNGTRVNGERVVGTRVLATADMIAIGGATLVYHADRLASEMTSRVLEFAEFRRRLEEETERAIRFHRAYALFCVHTGEVVGGQPAIESALTWHQRRLDVATWAGADELLLLLPETGAADAPPAAERLRETLTSQAPALRLGYVVCPDDGVDTDALIAAARGAASSAERGRVVPAAPPVRTLDIGGKKIVVADAAMIRLYAMIERLAAADLPTLLTGETGTGKEIAATAMHVRSPRRARPLVTLNCAAIQETLVESELFGYERGAFSGAVAAKPGLFEVASGGTVFLDEIGELSPSTQAKLLRALETKRITRLGDLREREVDIRLVAATNRDLLEEVEAGRFRRDLYFRLSGAVLAIPPLRKRVLELPMLAQTFLDEACARAGRPAMSISATATAMMRAHQWPGNLRELKNLMDYVAVAFTEPVVEPTHIAERLGATRIEVASRREQPVEREDPRADAPRSFRRLADEIAELERRRLTQALASSRGNHAQAARLLGVPLRTFFNKVKRYRIGSSPERGDPDDN